MMTIIFDFGTTVLVQWREQHAVLFTGKDTRICDVENVKCSQYWCPKAQESPYCLK